MAPPSKPIIFCQYEGGCTNRAHFNYLFQEEKYCIDHKAFDMPNLTNRLCKFVGDIIKYDKRGNIIDQFFGQCPIRASKSIPEYVKAMFCGTHSTSDMINTYRNNYGRLCPELLEDGTICGKTGIYNYVGEKPIYCVTHKTDGMENLSKNKCVHIFENGKRCNINPYFNFENEEYGKYCDVHKLDGMINIIDRCNGFEEDGTRCTVVGSYNIKGVTKRFCARHKTPEMTHKYFKMCTYCELVMVRDEQKYKGLCMLCFNHNYPDSPLIRNYKTKENSVALFIQSSFPELNIVYDKTIIGGTSRRRPDILITLNTHYIIIEVDEDCHTDPKYTKEYEQLRVDEIHSDLKFNNLVFIRFNPDAYIQNEKKITSCWNSDAKIKKNKVIEWNQRLNSLKEKVEYWVENMPIKIQHEYLFYNS